MCRVACADPACTFAFVPECRCAGEGGDKALRGVFVGQEKVQSFHERDSV